MAATLNKVYLMGNLTRDPELKYVPSGSAVANLGLAVNRSYTSQSGEKKDDVCYVRVIAWARLAEICGEYLSKGSSVLVEGRLQSRSWETEDGQKRTAIEIVAENIQFIGRKNEANKEGGGTAAPAVAAGTESFSSDTMASDEVPF